MQVLCLCIGTNVKHIKLVKRLILVDDINGRILDGKKIFARSISLTNGHPKYEEKN